MTNLEAKLYKEYGASLRESASLEREQLSLPKGSLQRKNINGKDYYYLQYREGGKVKSHYVKPSDVDDTKALLDRRRKNQLTLKDAKREQQQIERFFGNRKGELPLKVRVVLDEYVESVQTALGSKLSEIILYGSYARGDYKKDSDVDIMILVDTPMESAPKHRKTLSDISYDIFMDYGIDIQSVIQSETFFNGWAASYPYYANVRKEGKVLYESK